MMGEEEFDLIRCQVEGKSNQMAPAVGLVAGFSLAAGIGSRWFDLIKLRRAAS